MNEEKKFYCPVCEDLTLTEWGEQLEINCVIRKYRCLKHHILLAIERKTVPPEIKTLFQRSAKLK